MAAEAAATAAGTGGKRALGVRDARELLLAVALNSRAASCAAAQPANDAALAGTGLPLKSAPSPVGDLSAPSGLEASMGEPPGEGDRQWAAFYGAGTSAVRCMGAQGAGRPGSAVKGGYGRRAPGGGGVSRTQWAGGAEGGRRGGGGRVVGRRLRLV